MSVRVLICDDQALVRAGFRKLLESAPGIEVVGEAEDGLQAVEFAARRAPDVVLMEIRMPRLDGIEATRRIAQGPRPGARVLILTTFGLDDYVFASLRAGASGFTLKDAPPEELLSAIEPVPVPAAPGAVDAEGGRAGAVRDRRGADRLAVDDGRYLAVEAG
jgi:DNA-binding NarL/FixJ family response regulator